MKLFTTLYGKLVAILLGLVLLISIAFLLMVLMTNRLQLEAVDQSLNKALAGNIMDYIGSDRGATFEEAADFSRAVKELMLVNPRIEVYLLDETGKILSYSAPEGRVVRESVELAPIQAFVAGAADYPLRGDDPRSRTDRKIFSASPITKDGRVAGYIYAVLLSEAYASTAEIFERDYVLRLAVWLAIGVGIVTLAVGLFAFNLVTRRLRRLNNAILAFEASDLKHPAEELDWVKPAGGDEIDQAGRTFQNMSERLVAQVEMLKEEEDLRRELVANISHDLRTPLATLQGTIETLWLKRDKMTPDEQRQYLELSLGYSERLRKLIGELFELAILDTRDTVIEIEPFSIKELIQDVAQKFHLTAEKKDITLDVVAPDRTPAVLGDLGLIERVLDNLIDNAIKYSQSGGSVKLAFETGDWMTRIEVADSGPGIPEADLPHITDRFYRVDRTRSSQPSGTGLGLAITHKILQLHGSQLKVESQLGHGTRFWFELSVDRG